MELSPRLLKVFRKIFKTQNLVITKTTTAADVEGWDSLKHIELIVALEEEFGTRLQTKVILGFKNVEELAIALGALV